jgi:hypothetical protein
VRERAAYSVGWIRLVCNRSAYGGLRTGRQCRQGRDNREVDGGLPMQESFLSFSMAMSKDFDHFPDTRTVAIISCNRDG